ncbi:hypothetical protein J2X29_000720 [Shewanella putrefaciens]|nr:hypothetical protein [Shewanella putrefaciens]
MVICETAVRPMDGAVEHPRTDLLRVGEQMPWQTMSQNDEEPPCCPNPLSLLLDSFSISSILLVISRLFASKGITELKAVLPRSRYRPEIT